MQPSGAPDRGVMNEKQPDGALDTSDLWYNASCYECVSRHRIDTTAEDEDIQQEAEEHPTRTKSTDSEHNYFCDLLRCHAVKFENRNRQKQGRPTGRGHSDAPVSSSIEPRFCPYYQDGRFPEPPTEEDVGMENLRFHAHVPEQGLSSGLRRVPKLKGSVHGLRNRLKSSISNRSLRNAFREDPRNDAGPDQRSRLKSSASKFSLRTAFKRQQSPTDAQPRDARGLRSTFSNMSLRSAFQRKEPDFVMVSKDHGEVEDAPIPHHRKPIAMHDDSPARSLGLRQAFSNMSLRSSTVHAMSEDAMEVPTESIPSLARKKVGSARNLPARGLRQSVSSIALRAGIVSPEPERDDLGPIPTSARRTRLAIAGQLPPRGGVLIPPIPESPSSSTDGYQLIAKPELMVHTHDTKDVTDAGGMNVATGLRPLRQRSTVRRQLGSGDTLGETFNTQSKDKFCDPETLAILTGTSYSTSAPNHLDDYRPDWSDPFLQGYLASRRVGRPIGMGQGDGGHRPPAKSPPRPSSASSTLERDDVSVLRDSELFANFDSEATRVSPLSVPWEERSDRNAGSTAKQDLRHNQLQRNNSSSALHARPRSLWRTDDASIRGGSHRHSLDSFAFSWAASNADDFWTFLDAAEYDEL